MRLRFLLLVLASFLFIIGCGGDDPGAITPPITTGSEAGVDSGATPAASCTDGKKNGSESDVDCGGTCSKCAADKACGSAADCSSGVCTANKCVTPAGAPTITSFTAEKTTITSGTTTKLTAVFAGGSGV